MFFFIVTTFVWSFNLWLRLSNHGNVTLASFRYFLPYLTILTSYNLDYLRNPSFLIVSVTECLQFSYCIHRVLKNRRRAKNLGNIFVYSTFFLSLLFSQYSLVQDKGSALRGQVLQIMETVEDHGWCPTSSSLRHFPSTTWVDFYSPGDSAKVTNASSSSLPCDLKAMTKMKNTLIHKHHPDKHHGSPMYDCYTEVTAFLTSAFEEVQVYCKAANKIHKKKEREVRKKEGKGDIDGLWRRDLERFKRQGGK